MDYLRWCVAICLLFAGVVPGAAPLSAEDWPTVHHDAQRSGFTRDSVRPPYVLRWVAEFPGEIVATRVEAIVGGGRVFVGTQNGTLWSLDRDSGAVRWQRRLAGAILHSPAFAGGKVYCGDAGGSMWGLDAATGNVIWEFRSNRGGFAASPLVLNDTVYIGSRDGSFYAIDALSGARRWQFTTGGPIRNTAAESNGTIVFASDDMHVYTLRAADGSLVWKSEKLAGQSLRDYFPVIAGDRVILRTVCVEEMNDELNGGTQFLQRLAGIDGDWRELDKFFKSIRTRGSPEAIRAEQDAIKKRLTDNSYRRTFFVLDLATGQEAVRTPVMYAAGNQGCGFPPVLTRAGRPIVFYRTVYSNWNLGVKPAVGLGFLDLASGYVEPIRHSRGHTPPWNTFWGTSDESQAFTVGGDLLYICHQGTLSGLDLLTNDLFPVHGNRDTWGGLLAPIWAANEWHGPARGACAVSDDQLFWITGSRVLCIEHGTGPAASHQPTRWNWEPATAATPAAINVDELVRRVPPQRDVASGNSKDDAELIKALHEAVREYLDGAPWSPLYLQMGIGSRDFYFAHPSFVVQALSAAFPHLPPELAARAKSAAREQLPGCLQAQAEPLDRGRRRELFDVPPHDLTWSYAPRWPAISHLYAVWLYGERTSDWDAVREQWPAIQRVWREYQQQPLTVDGSGGHLWLNRTAAGCLAMARLARRFESLEDENAAKRELDRLLRRIVEYHRAKADAVNQVMAQSTSKGDTSGNQGRLLYFHLNNHKSKIALYLDLTPEIADAIRTTAPQETEVLRAFVELLMPAWHLAAEERQIHYGENFVDLPDSVHGLFLAHAFLWQDTPERLRQFIDIPWCRADLFHIEKLVYAVEKKGE